MLYHPQGKMRGESSPPCLRWRGWLQEQLQGEGSFRSQVLGPCTGLCERGADHETQRSSQMLTSGTAAHPEELSQQLDFAC